MTGTERGLAQCEWAMRLGEGDRPIALSAAQRMAPVTLVDDVLRPWTGVGWAIEFLDAAERRRRACYDARVASLICQPRSNMGPPVPRAPLVLSGQSAVQEMNDRQRRRRPLLDRDMTVEGPGPV